MDVKVEHRVCKFQLDARTWHRPKQKPELRGMENWQYFQKKHKLHRNPFIPQRLIERTSQPGRIAWHKLCEEIREDRLTLCSCQCSREAPPGSEEHAVAIPSRRPVKQGVATAERQLLGVRWIEPHDFVEGTLGDL